MVRARWSEARRGGLEAIAIAIAAGVLVGLAAATDWYDSLRERTFDAMLAALVRPPPVEAVIVDIDREALALIGPWPWSRAQLAELIERISAAGPRAVGLDMVLAGPDERSPAALARKLKELTGEDVAARATGPLEDGDQRLAAALGRGKVVLGAVIDPEEQGERIRASPVLLRGRIDIEAIWHGAGAIGATPVLARAAVGHGVVALAGDGDGIVRRVPLLAAAGSQLLASLPAEVIRAGAGASPVVVNGLPGEIVIAGRALPIDADATLRLVPPAEASPRQVVAAGAALTDAEALKPVAGRLVLVGGSAPELGAPRSVAFGRLASSVSLHAAGLDQLLAGLAPARPASVGSGERIAIALAVLAGALAGLGLRPLRAVAAGLVLAVAWSAGAGLALAGALVLVDPIAVPAGLLLALTGAAMLAASRVALRERQIRRRFEQHLAPEIVARIVAEPGLLKLGGELREVTALFSDIGGFTAMTERSEPRALVAVLDRYFEGLTQIVVEHGGLVDKIVGDGLRAIFNAPFDLADHPRRAIECAAAMIAFADRFRLEGDPLALGFGRTRIGLETGPAIVGDVGGGRKLDYTAHGNAINAAARLEALNKEVGTRVCIGAGTAARLPAGRLRPLGEVTIRGQSAPLAIFDLWPAAMEAGERQAYLTVLAGADAEPAAAIAALERFAAGDAAVERLSERLRSQSLATRPPATGAT
jgi:adenylate cyclase